MESVDEFKNKVMSGGGSYNIDEKTGKLNISFSMSGKDQSRFKALIKVWNNDINNEKKDDNEKKNNNENYNEKMHDKMHDKKNDKKNDKKKVPPKGFTDQWMKQFGQKVPANFRQVMPFIPYTGIRMHGTVKYLGKKLNLVVSDHGLNDFYAGTNNPEVTFNGLIFQCRMMNMVDEHLKCGCGEAQPVLNGVIGEDIEYIIVQRDIMNPITGVSNWTHVLRNMVKLNGEPWSCSWVQHMVDEKKCNGIKKMPYNRYDEFDSEEWTEPDFSATDSTTKRAYDL